MGNKGPKAKAKQPVEQESPSFKHTQNEEALSDEDSPVRHLETFNMEQPHLRTKGST